MTTREQAHAAARLVKDETFIEAVEKRLSLIKTQLFAATTPEDREQKFQEHSALNRVVTDLKKQAREVRNFEAK